ncbi:prolyl oligopeptidase family serine peptidase [Nocardioides sp.]|uniref:S9 family peptidase n=1 Tax=Nocardioides sp. TaxID=35761 RepID=UPI002617DEE2|nr:prolyl oligopeptidase family serine peptidase [Nocardioides sp.]
MSLPSGYAHAPLHADLTYDARWLTLSTAGPDGIEVSVLDLETGTEEPLGAGYGATWSPWGRRLAWIDADAEDGTIVLREPDGSRRTLPGSAGAASAPLWSPDGAHLAFTAATAQPVDRSEPFRWTRPYLDFDGLGPLDAPPQVLIAGAHDDEEPRLLTDDGWRWSLLRWSPDATRIAAAAGIDPEDRIGGQQLHVLGLDGSRLTPAVPAGRSFSVEWLSDTCLLVLVFEPTPGAEPELYRVDLGDATAPPVVTLTTITASGEVPGEVPGLGGDVYGDHPAELVDTGDRLLLAVDEDLFLIRTVTRGAMGIALARIDGSDVTVTAYVGGERTCTPVGFSNGRLVMATIAPDQWAQIACVDWATGEERVVRRFTEAAPAMSVERFRVSTDAVAPIDAWFLRPAEATGPLPTVLLVHGGPHYSYGESFSLDAVALVEAGFGVLYANPRGSTGTSTEFATSVQGDWAEGPSRDLLAVVDEAVARGWADDDRLGIAGNSYGGYMAAWLGATTRRFGAAVAENPVTDLASMYFTSDIGPRFFTEQMLGTPLDRPERYRDQSPLYRSRGARTPTLFVTGTEDRRCPAPQAWSMHRQLCAVGTPSEVLVLPGSAHEGSTYGPASARRAHDEALVAWMERFIPGTRTRP